MKKMQSERERETDKTHVKLNGRWTVSKLEFRKNNQTDDCEEEKKTQRAHLFIALPLECLIDLTNKQWRRQKRRRWKTDLKKIPLSLMSMSGYDKIQNIYLQMRILFRIAVTHIDFVTWVYFLGLFRYLFFVAIAIQYWHERWSRANFSQQQRCVRRLHDINFRFLANEAHFHKHSHWSRCTIFSCSGVYSHLVSKTFSELISSSFTSSFFDSVSFWLLKLFAFVCTCLFLFALLWCSHINSVQQLRVSWFHLNLYKLTCTTTLQPVDDT